MDTADGQAFSNYPHIGFLGHEGFQIFTATANLDHTKTDLVPNLRSNASYLHVKNKVTSFFAYKMACEYKRRIILSWMKSLNCSLRSIAVKIWSQNIKFVHQMRINKGLLMYQLRFKRVTIALISATFFSRGHLYRGWALRSQVLV